MYSKSGRYCDNNKCYFVPTKSQLREVLVVRLIEAKDPNKFIELTFIAVANGRDVAHRGVT